MYSGLASERRRSRCTPELGLVLAKPHGDETISGEIGLQNFRGVPSEPRRASGSQITATHGASMVAGQPVSSSHRLGTSGVWRSVVSGASDRLGFR